MRPPGPSFRRSCAIGLGAGAFTFALWSVTFLLANQPVGNSSWIVAAIASVLIAIAFGHLRLRLACARRQEPAGLQLFHSLTCDLPVMLYQFRQYPTGRTSVTRASDAIRTIYELTPEEAQKDGAAILDLVHPEDRDRIWKSLVKSYRDLTPWHEEYRVTLPKAGTVWRAAHARVQRLPDGGSLWHGFIIDIDDQKKNAAELEEQRRRAEYADRAKSEFLAMMSHDIRTPMSAVLGFAELLSNTELSDDQKEFLSSIRTSGESLLLLINEILDLSRVESGTLELCESSFTLNEWLSDLSRMLTLRAIAKGITFHVEIDAGTPRSIYADRARLTQVLQNLGENAIKFTDEGSVHLHVSATEGPTTDTLLWTFSLKDTGIGIPSDKLAGLFEPFRQARDSDAGRQNGVGLGLAIARRISQKMGGDITVGSQLGTGTCITVTVQSQRQISPALAALGSAESTSPTGTTVVDPIDFKGLRILLVEDNPLNQRLASLILDQLGCTCEIVGDGSDAIKACRENSYDLVLMDFELPTISGPDATREIRNLQLKGQLANDGHKLPIVALTANALPEQRQQCIDAGMDDVLTKPIRRPELIKVLESARSGSAASPML